MESVLLSRISSYLGDNGLSTATMPSKSSNGKNNREQKIAFISFSKDRPFQLNQLLRSVALFWHPPPSFQIVLWDSLCPRFNGVTSILARYNPGDWSNEYANVFEQYPQVHTILEQNFASDFLTMLEMVEKAVGSAHFVNFCVDDLIFINTINSRWNDD